MPKPRFEGVSEGRRRNMQANRSKDTRPELAVRKHLHARGYRFRLHRTDLPGRPDIIFAPRKAIIEVRGCFWHGHGCSPLGKIPASRPEYWIPKIESTKQRDAKNMATLCDMGWRVLEIWECDIRSQFDVVADQIDIFLGPVKFKKNI